MARRWRAAERSALVWGSADPRGAAGGRSEAACKGDVLMAAQPGLHVHHGHVLCVVALRAHSSTKMVLRGRDDPPSKIDGRKASEHND